MKKLVIASLAFISSSVYAAPYMGLEYGAATVKNDYQTNYGVDNKTVSPGNSSSVFGGFIGYNITNNYAVELGYKQFDLDGGESQMLTSDKEDFYLEREWESDLSVKQILIKPVFFYSLSEKMRLKSGVGLTYSQYKYTSSSHDEYEHILNDDIEVNQMRTGGEHKKETALGAILSVGIDYNIYHNIILGVGMEYYADKIANGGNFTIQASYFI